MIKRNEKTAITPRGASRRLLEESLSKAHDAARELIKESVQNARQNFEDAFSQYRKIYPDHSGSLSACMNMEDYERVCERLIILEPNDPDLVLSLAGAYLSNSRTALALKKFQSFLERWPAHKSVEDVHRTVAQLEDGLEEITSDWSFPEEKAIDLAVELEQMGQFLERGQFKRGITLGEAIIKQFPFFTPVYKNLSWIFWMEGKANKAISLMKKVLEIMPEKIYALSELTRYYILTGSIGQARIYAERLMNFKPTSIDEAIKIIEAFSYLGEDHQIINTMHTLEQRGVEVNPDTEGALLLHIAAVSFYRMGKEEEARQLWKRALQFSPDFNLASENLKDLEKKVSERHSPWVFTIDYWIQRKVIEELYQRIPPQSHQEKGAKVQAEAQRFLIKHKEIVSIAPLMLDRGDAVSREFILGLARLVENKDLHEAVKDFALGKQASDDVRWEAVKIAINGGVLPTGMIPFWSNGRWGNVLVLGMKIEDKNVRSHGKKVEKLLHSALEALNSYDGEKAEEFLRQALQIEPNEVDLLNNLAMTYQLQGRLNEAKTMIRKINTRYPDYLLGRTSLAMMCIQEGNLDLAKEMLEPLRWLKHMNHSEFDAFCATHIELSLAEKKKELAESWFKMWKSMDPENSRLERYRFRFDNTL